MLFCRLANLLDLYFYKIWHKYDSVYGSAVVRVTSKDKLKFGSNFYEIWPNVNTV